jgi:hypothetical protein
MFQRLGFRSGNHLADYGGQDYPQKKGNNGGAHDGWKTELHQNDIHIFLPFPCTSHRVL